MAGYAAFLRGINVGGHRVSGGELRSCLEAAGLRDVQTFRASGNVVFAADGEPGAEMASAIERALAEALGYEVAAFLRTAGEVRAIAEREPFDPALVAASAGKLQVLFLSGPPAAGAGDDVLALATEEDRLAFGERELYWLPSGRMMESTLDLKEVERLLGQTTMRTKGTVEQIAAKYFAP